MPESLAQRFNQRCAPYAPMVYRHCLHMLKRREEAEDAAQESMLRAFRAYGEFKGDRVTTWLFRIAHNTCLDVLKSARMQREVFFPENYAEMEDAAPDPEAVYLDNAAKDELWAAVEALPPEQQVLLSLYYGDGLSYAQLAQALGLNEGTVKSRLSRAKDALRKRWKPDE